METMTTGSTTPGPQPYMPGPWRTLHEFLRMILTCCVATLGPIPGSEARQIQEAKNAHFPVKPIPPRVARAHSFEIFP
jgi:hypothetical protein